MHLKKLEQDFSVCKVEDLSKVNLDSEFCFIGKTDEERSTKSDNYDRAIEVLEQAGYQFI